MFMAGSKVTTAVDAYAFGIMAWEIYTSKRAYAGERQSAGASANLYLPWMPPPLPHSTQLSSPHPNKPLLSTPPGLPRDVIVSRVYRSGMRPHFPSAAPPAFVAICESCWQTDPARRPTFGDIADMLEHLAVELAPSDNGASVEGPGYPAPPPPAAAAPPSMLVPPAAAGTLPWSPATVAAATAAHAPVAAPAAQRLAA
jgi:hypothetical protein